MATSSTITLLAASTKAASDSGEAVEREEYSAARLTLAVSAASGTTPSLTVYIDTSEDGIAWTQLQAFTATSMAGSESVSVAGMWTYVRARWLISGAGASFTFSVSGTSFVCYAGPGDLAAHGLPAVALASKTSTEKAEALIAASQEINGRFNGRFAFPLTSWGTDVTKYTARMAAVDLLFSRGVNPDAPDFETYSAMRSAAEKWAELVGQKKIDPPDIVDSTPTVEEAASQMYTKTKRGW